MAPAERAAHLLSEQISESNALNRAIQINLVSECESEGEEDGDETELETDEKKEKIVSSGFFQKRTKTTSTATSLNRPQVKLKRISSSDPPPYPLEFQLIKTDFSIYEIFNFESRFPVTEKTRLRLLKPCDIKPKLKVSLSNVIKWEYSNMSSSDLDLLNNITTTNNNCIIRSLFAFKKSREYKGLLTMIFNEIQLVTDYEENPVLWVIMGPTGCGKTGLVQELTDKLGLRLITIDSTQIPRNSKTFETLHTTLTHSTPKSFSQFFSPASSTFSPLKAKVAAEREREREKEKVAILFDEVEIAFEGSDRGYWTALSAFLQTSHARSVPIFITSNASKLFLESIIKFPDHVQFTKETFLATAADFRMFLNNSNFIGRLHRADTSIEYEHFIIGRGGTIEGVGIEGGIDGVGFDDQEHDHKQDQDHKNLIFEALRWDGLIESVVINSRSNSTETQFSIFEYYECSSLADLLISIQDHSIKDFVDNNYNNFQSEFHEEDLIGSFNSLLYSSIPENYVNVNETSINIARELVERTITTSGTSIKTTTLSPSLEELSQKISKRFYDYTRSLNPLNLWKTELTNHVKSIEVEHFKNFTSRSRRKRPYFRYLGEDLLNEILRK